MNALKQLGLDEKSAGKFIMDNEIVTELKVENEAVEILPSSEAIEKYGEYYFKAISPDKDKYTKMVSDGSVNGYFIRVKEGHTIDLPIQTAFVITDDGLKQLLHNVIVLEKNARLNILSGCLASAYRDMHVSVTEFYLDEGSYLTYTMIHNWARDTEVYPRTAAMLKKNATFISNYISLTRAKMIQSSPVAYLDENAIARFYSILYAKDDSKFDIGGIAKMNGEGSRSEIISRVISQDSDVVSRGLIEGNANHSKGHMECSGLLLGSGIIHTIPELKSSVENVDLSHEAAIGKLAEDELYYLMARGIVEDEAKSLLIRGFLDVGIKGIPPAIREQIDRAIDIMAVASF